MDAAAIKCSASMWRILIIGLPGAGKSTLARSLFAKLELPVVHLDRLFWLPGWIQRDRGGLDVLLATALARPCWIIDGNYARTLPQRLALADTIIWLDYGRLICLTRALWRIIRSYGRTRADMAKGCLEQLDLEFLRYIWSFRVKERPRIAAAVETFGRHARLVRLTSPREARHFLSSLEDGALG